VDAVLLSALLALAVAPFINPVLHRENIAFGTDVGQHYSRESVNRRAFTDTWIPLWNPYEFSGFPTQADPQTGVFYPPNIVLRLFSLSTFVTWTAIFHIWMFGAGMYALCRVAGVRRVASAIAAAGLMLGGIPIGRMYAGHFDVIRTVAWVPLGLAAGIRSIDRQSLRPTVPAVAVLSLELLGSFLQLFCYTLAAIGLYAVFAYVFPKWGHRPAGHLRATIVHYCLLVALVLGITAFQLLPTARLDAAAGRTQGMPYEQAIESALHIGQLRQVMFGAPPSPIPMESWEVSAYVGWLLPVLAPLAFFVRTRRRMVVYFTILGTLALFLATGGPLYRFHYWLFPMFRIPGRFMCFWAIGVGLLGAVALDWLAGPGSEPLEARTGDSADGRSAGSRARYVLLLLIAAIVVSVDGSLYTKHFVRVNALADRFASSVPFTPARFGRVLSLCEDRIQTGELTALGVPSVDGYNSYFLGDYARLAVLARGERPTGQLKAFERIGATAKTPDFDILNALNVTEIITCEPLEQPGLELLMQRERFRLYKNTRALGRVAVSCESDPAAIVPSTGVCGDGAQIEIQEGDSPRGHLKFRVSLPAARTLLLSEPYYPERRAWVDGVETPIEKANVALSAIRVNAGIHAVVLEYVPSSLRLGAAISGAVVLLWLFGSWRSRRTHFYSL
jgi:hypothetical protein